MPHSDHTRDRGDSIIGRSKVWREVQGNIRAVAGYDCSVLVIGETGTGKESTARAVHDGSPRRDDPFVPVNCSAFPEQLIEDELFGHERGAFTGAVTTRAGLFEQANGGTIFLDEIAELPLSVQAKLLRVLQQREIVRIGSDRAAKPIAINFRVVAATNKNLRDEVAAGRFREDLYYRLAGCTIQLPPLRDRGTDVVLIARAYLQSREFAAGGKHLSRGAEALLCRYRWSGNVRELQNVVGQAAIFTAGACISEKALRASAEQAGCLLGDTGRQEQDPAAWVREHLQQHGRVTAGEVRARLHVSRSTALRLLRDLEARGAIAVVGKGRGVHYVAGAQVPCAVTEERSSASCLGTATSARR